MADYVLYNDHCASSSSHSSCDIDYQINEDIPLDAQHLNRVHEELEKLNIATDVINKLELQLDEARETFRQIQASWSQRLNELSNKYGSAIEKARPYYEAKLEERRLRDEAQNAAIRFQRATSMHAVAKQQVSLTQDSLNRQSKKSIQAECLEVLNHHINRVNEAEKERIAAQGTHRTISSEMARCAQNITAVEKTSGRAIKKCKYYFEQRIEFTRILERQKSLILKLEAEVRQKKYDYTTSLKNLEQISDSIHEERSLSGMKRESGVGCDSPELSPSEVFVCEKTNRAHLEEKRRQQEENEKHIALEDIKCKLDEITVEYDKTIDISMFEDYALSDESDEHRPSTHGIGSGVILLAQQLIGNQEKYHYEQKKLPLNSNISDFCYRTELPEGVNPVIRFSSAENSDSEGSLASNRTDAATINTEDLCGMLRSHSQLIEEIDECAQRTEDLLHSSNAEQIIAKNFEQ